MNAAPRSYIVTRRDGHVMKLTRYLRAAYPLTAGVQPQARDFDWSYARPLALRLDRDGARFLAEVWSAIPQHVINGVAARVEDADAPSGEDGW